MSKALRVVATVAAVVAVVAATVATFGATIGLTAATIATIATIATVASAVSAIASAGAVALQKKPALKGTISAVMIGATMPIPYAMGHTMVGGMQVYDDSAGENNKKRTQIMVVTAAGPVEEFEDYLVDYAVQSMSGDAAIGWYSEYLYIGSKTGERPDTAFNDSVTPMRGWSADHKLSGYAAYKPVMRFDKEGKRFASGVPQFGAIGKWVKVYDPRLDSTYPGGSGSHRWDDEATFTWSENPGLHALNYARGRFIEKDAAGVPLATPVRIVGAALPKDAIDLASFVEMANLCDANEWTVGGAVYEGPDLSKWDNLKRICQAGGAKPMWSGGMLRRSE